MDFTCNFVENYVDKGFSVAIEFDFFSVGRLCGSIVRDFIVFGWFLWKK